MRIATAKLKGGISMFTSFLGSRKNGDADVRHALAYLNNAGYDAGTADGLMGGATAAALNAFRSDCGLDVSCALTPETRAFMGL